MHFPKLGSSEENQLWNFPHIHEIRHIIQKFKLQRTEIMMITINRTEQGMKNLLQNSAQN